MAGSAEGADFVLLGGRIFTVDHEHPWAEACAIRDGKFLAVGTNEEIRPLAGTRTRMIDLDGRLVLPGFNDAHLHFSQGGFSLLGVDLRPARDEQDFVSRIRGEVARLPAGEWIEGGNWDHEAWPSRRLPRKELIDPVSPRNPVFVERLDGHIAVANSLALKLAGITRDTPDPQGGAIERDPGTGEATGILKDNAMDLVQWVIPPPSPQKRERAIVTALEHANRLGVTSIQDNADSSDMAVYRKLLRQRRLSLRIRAWYPADTLVDFEKLGLGPDFGDPLLRIGTIKLFVDGSMGAGTALFFEPYADSPGTRGIAIHPQQELDALVAAIDRAGLQIAAHAIGDQANHWILDAFERAQQSNGRREARHRIEHAQVVKEDDVRRFADLGVIASIEPVHCIDDMHWAQKRIGERVRDAYRFRSFLRSGVHVAFGTDWDVEPLNPLLGLYAAVTREFIEGGPVGGWFPDEKISLEQAVECYTLGAAFAEFQEQVKGSIQKGKYADLVVLDRDIFRLPASDILKAQVDMTVVGGELVFSRCRS